jgi:hypothetical protein
MSRKIKGNLPSFIKKTLPVFVGGIAAVSALGLIIRYYGDSPIISDVAKGLNGDVVGLFK